jgi:hypothetical protein
VIPAHRVESAGGSRDRSQNLSLGGKSVYWRRQYWGVLMNWVKKFGLFSVSSAMVFAPVAPSLAQGAPAGFMTTYFEEHDYGGQHCPGLTWHIDRITQPDKTVKISGPIWYADGSGVSFAKGTGEPDGHFMLTVSTMSGDGPAGTITGQRHPDGSIDSTAVGPPCFAGTRHIAPGQTSAKSN